MKTLGSLFGVFFILLGVIGIGQPGEIVSIGYRLDTPFGLYCAAAVRIVIGLVLFAAASHSRAPTALHIMGGIIVVLGIATAFIDVDRARAVLNWFSSQGVTFMRVPFVVMMMIGIFIISALTSKHRDVCA